ncbi:AT hook motif domain containing protein, expressed [Datura stramonium]|uniref:AT-hook motif nuclear-localized protein n=1 Tax=Datura stramonium TaxID=4076 RepID=A0ABS8SXZ4_DATST|nr:AT hook motif domain containing protein, expressed [Datura stramonium]
MRLKKANTRRNLLHAIEHHVALNLSFPLNYGNIGTEAMKLCVSFEDVLAKLMSFSQSTSQAVSILSANGSISNVSLWQAATSGGTVTYEGRFEILTLSGTFLISESGGQHSRTGGLSVSLAGPDGRVLGGGVAGLLTAAAAVQVIVGSFSTGQRQLKSGNSDTFGTPATLVSGASAARSPPSLGTQSESSGGPVNPHNLVETSNSSPSGVANLPWR